MRRHRGNSQGKNSRWPEHHRQGESSLMWSISLTAPLTTCLHSLANPAVTWTCQAGSCLRPFARTVLPHSTYTFFPCILLTLIEISVQSRGKWMLLNCIHSGIDLTYIDWAPTVCQALFLALGIWWSDARYMSCSYFSYILLREVDSKQYVR